MPGVVDGEDAKTQKQVILHWGGCNSCKVQSSTGRRMFNAL